MRYPRSASFIKGCRGFHSRGTQNYLMQIIVEGWRFLAHSYAIINQFQCLEMLRRPNVTLCHRDAPYYAAHWQPVKGLFPAAAEARLHQLASPDPTHPPDAILRMSYPHDFAAASTQRLAVFVTAELGMVKKIAIAHGQTLQEAHNTADALIITPSQWSQRGILQSGADPARVRVVPHGVETNLFYPLPAAERSRLRAQLGWHGFVFLNIGTMGGNKGIPLLLKAFAAIAAQYPEARLALKGLDSLYGSHAQLTTLCQTLTADQTLTAAEMHLVQARLLYIGNTLTFAETAQLYQAADAYVSPYFAEGFNLPVLEAIASGLPVICTAGGPTDDFTQPAFALTISSHLQELDIDSTSSGYCLIPDLDHLISLMQTVLEQTAFRTQARSAGPRFIAEQFTWKHAIDKLLNVLSAP